MWFSLQDRKDDVHAALCDSLDTSSALRALLGLIRDCNAYVDAQHNLDFSVDQVLLTRPAVYVTDIFRLFGLAEEGEYFCFPFSYAPPTLYG